MPTIHPTALVGDGAKIADSVTIGPYCVVGPDVVLGENVTLHSHAVVEGWTTLEEGVQVHSFAVVGGPPQHLRYKGEPTRVEIGRNTLVREHATVNRGTSFGTGLTKVGANVLLAIGSHIAHDCVVGDDCQIMNHVLLGGHVTIGANAIIGGGAAIHQFARIGRGAMIGGMSGVEGDVIPNGVVMGKRARLEGLNIIGLKRRGTSRDDIHMLRAAYRMLFGSGGTGVWVDRLKAVREAFPDSPAVQEVIDFLAEDSHRSLCRPERVAGGDMALSDDDA